MAYFRIVKSKWYIEFSVVVGMIILAIVFAWNVNFSTGGDSKANEKVFVVKKDAVNKSSSEDKRWKEGKELFKINCASCHNAKFDGTGPALKGATARWRAAGGYQNKKGEEWMRVWIRNYNDVIKAGYKYGVDMANSRPAQMNVFPSITDEQIDNIMLYVENSDRVQYSATYK